MSISQALLDTVLRTAQDHGLDQSQLARRAGLRAETLSRAKRRGTIDLSSLQALAEAVDLRLALIPNAGKPSAPADIGAPLTLREPPPRSPLAAPQWGLAWSNPEVSDEVLIRKALSHGNFDLILEAVAAHGLEPVRRQWAQVARTLPLRARKEVERKLRNIEKGMAHAET